MLAPAVKTKPGVVGRAIGRGASAAWAVGFAAFLVAAADALPAGVAAAFLGAALAAPRLTAISQRGA